MTGMDSNRKHAHPSKRLTDLQWLTNWIEPDAKVLDLGCGRGVLLEYLRQQKNIYPMGVDMDLKKVMHCLHKKLNVFHGDAESLLKEFPDQLFDWVIISRTVQELNNPGKVIRDALRVGRHLAVGFVNFGYWENRLSFILHGDRIQNSVYPKGWSESGLSNHVSIAAFEAFCRNEGITLNRVIYLKGDWATECTLMPNLLAGYALYDLSLNQAKTPDAVKLP